MPVSPIVIVALIGSGTTLFASGLGAWALLRAKTKVSPGEIQTAINEGFETFMERADDERKALQSSVKDIQHREGECQRRLTMLEGRIRGLNQYIASLVQLLRRHGIEVPEHPRLPFYGEEAGVVIEGESRPVPNGSARRGGRAGK